MWRLYQNNKIGRNVDTRGLDTRGSGETRRGRGREGEKERERREENVDINIPRYISSVPQECRN